MVCKICPDLFCTDCIVSLHENQVCLLALKERFHLFLFVFCLGGFFGRFLFWFCWNPIISKSILHSGFKSLEMLLITLTGLFFHQWFTSWFSFGLIMYIGLQLLFFFPPSLLESKKFGILERKSVSPCLPLYIEFFLQFVFTLTVFGTQTPCDFSQ